MFSAASGGSKTALVCLSHLLHDWGFVLLDAQVGNSHLYSMGAQDMPRPEFLDQLATLSAARPDANAFQLTDAMAVSGFA